MNKLSYKTLPRKTKKAIIKIIKLFADEPQQWDSFDAILMRKLYEKYGKNGDEHLFVITKHIQTKPAKHYEYDPDVWMLAIKTFDLMTEEIEKEMFCYIFAE